MMQDFEIKDSILIKYHGQDTHVLIPEGVTKIGIGAFDHCCALTSIMIPKTVTAIMGYAFSGCSNLKMISIPEGVTYIGGAAFMGCSGLTEIIIPVSTTIIDESAFYYCKNLKKIEYHHIRFALSKELSCEWAIKTGYYIETFLSDPEHKEAISFLSNNSKYLFFLESPEIFQKLLDTGKIF